MGCQGGPIWEQDGIGLDRSGGRILLGQVSPPLPSQKANPNTRRYFWLKCEREKTLAWDGLSGDYSPSFVSLTLSSGTYVVHDRDLGGVVAYGGSLSLSSTSDKNTVVATVQTRDPVRRRVFIGPLGVPTTTDAGVKASSPSW